MWQEWWNPVVANWPVIVIGVLGTSAALRTLRVIRRQTDALVEGQRGWIVMDTLGEPTLSDDVQEKPVGMPMQTPLLVFNLRTVGSTTVKITGTGVRFHLTRPKDGGLNPEPWLPEEPDYKIDAGILPQAGFVKAPNEGMQIAKALEDGHLSPDQLVSIQSQKLFVCAYGFVTYTDAFERSHETRFCYVYRVSYLCMISDTTGKNVFPSRFILGGPEAYNRYT